MKNDKEKFKNDFKRRLYNFALRLIGLLDKLPNDNISKRLGDQLLRSGTSILANYVEGRASSSKKEFTNYFHISLKSANESKVWPALLRDSKRIKSEHAEWYLQELNEISNIFGSSLLTLKGKK
jgi:four helix bundle protein